MNASILAVDDNKVNLRIVSAALQQVGYQVHTAENGLQALEMAERLKPDVILLDISMPDIDGYEVCQRLRSNRETQHIPIMMLTAFSTVEDKIKGLEVGADDYLTKPFHTAELQARVKVLLRRSLQAVETKRTTKGRIISVFSLRGGVGKTTIATNLAGGLVNLWGKPVALADFSLTMGQCALMLNLSFRNTWADIARIPIDEIESEVLRNVMLKHDSGISVLAAPRVVRDAELVSPEHVQRVLELIVDLYDYTVLDLPSDFQETTLAALDRSDQIMLVVSPELASVRAAVGALGVFRELGYTERDISIVLNWTFQRKGLGRKDIEKVLKQPIDFVIPFAPDPFIKGINLGIPPVLDEPEEALATLFEDFAWHFSSDLDRQETPSAPTPAWMRLQARQDQR